MPSLLRLVVAAASVVACHGVAAQTTVPPTVTFTPATTPSAEQLGIALTGGTVPQPLNVQVSPAGTPKARN